MTKGKATLDTLSMIESALTRGDPEKMLEMIEHTRQQKNDVIRRLVIEKKRVDILAREVLGFQVQPHHLAMMTWQARHRKSLNLVFRGAGKTTTCTVVRAIAELCADRNLRILIASKSTGNAESFLKEIKAHLMGNERLIEIFGDFYDGKRNGKWDNREIEVIGRTTKAKEGNITCVGVDGTVVSKHYDMILSDDLVDEANASTQHMREKTRTWYFQTLLPTLEPPDPAIPARGSHHHSGTRYHYLDLWGQLMEEGGALHGRAQVIPAIRAVPNPDGGEPIEMSCWPEKFPIEHFQETRRESGTIIFNAQYQCDTEAMKGEIFRYDDCQRAIGVKPGDGEIPKDLRIFQGVDLAIGEKELNDKFAHVTIGHEPKTGCYYVLDFWEGQLRFADQTKKILELYDKWKPIRVNVEAVAYQAAQVRNVKDKRPDARVVGVDVREDKVTRAQKLSAPFEDMKFFFAKTGNMHMLIEQLVLMPNVEHDDGFDALDLAVRASKMKTKKQRSEPRLI